MPSDAKVCKVNTAGSEGFSPVWNKGSPLTNAMNLCQQHLSLPSLLYLSVTYLVIPSRCKMNDQVQSVTRCTLCHKPFDQRKFSWSLRKQGVRQWCCRCCDCLTRAISRPSPFERKLTVDTKNLPSNGMDITADHGSWEVRIVCVRVPLARKPRSVVVGRSRLVADVSPEAMTATMPRPR